MEKLTPEQAYAIIVEWLYLNDKQYPDKIDWRKAFLEHLSETLKKIK